MRAGTEGVCAGSAELATVDSRAMTIEKLKKIIAELPDEMLVFASQHDDWDEPYRVSAAKVQEIDIGRALILKATPYDEEDEDEEE